MNIERSLVSLVDLSSRRFDGTGNFSGDSFENTLNIISSRDVRNTRNDRVAVRENNVVNTRENNNSRNVSRDSRVASREAVSSNRHNNNRGNNIIDESTSTSAITEPSNVANEGIDYVVDTSIDDLDIMYNPMAHIVIIPIVAEVLNMPEDGVKSILDELDMQPQDLQDKSNLSQFMQVVHDVESPVELLDVPDIAQTLATISESIEDVVESMPKIANSITKPTESRNKPKVDINTNLNQENTNSQHSEHIEEEHPTLIGENVGEVPTDKSTSTPQNVFNVANAANAQAGKPSSILADVSAEGKVHFNVDKASVTTKGTPIKSQPVQPPIAQDVVNQITERIKVDVKAAVSEVRMLLKPENLGEISLKVMTENGIVTAQFLADNHKVKEIIEANLNELKEALTNQGIDVSELSVSVGQDDAGSQMESFLKEQEKSQQRISKIIRDIMDEPEIENHQDSIDMANIYNNNVNYTA